MAYNGRQDRYQQTQYQSAPQQHFGQNGRDYNQYPPSHGYQERHGQEHVAYQGRAYESNQQYAQGYGSTCDQGQYQRQMYADPNSQPIYHDERGGQQYEQPRAYNYDDRFRNHTQPEQHYEELQPPLKGRHSPQSRPGTSASSRKVKQERILNSAGFDEPKAVPWDNPFGMFPGTKKDAQQKKKTAEEARSKSRTETPTGRPETAASSARPPTSSGPRDKWTAPVTQTLDDRRPHTSHAYRPQSVEDNPTLLNGLSTDGPYGPAEDVPTRQKRISNSRPQYDAYGSTYQSPVAEPARPPPHRTAIGQGPDRQAISSPQTAQAKMVYGREAYTDNADNGRQQDFSSDTRFNDASRVADDRQWTDADNSRFQKATRLSEEYRDRRWDGQGGSRNDPIDYSGRGDPGGLVYGSVKASKSMTNLNDAPVPNFAAMPANATENIERQVNRQSRTFNQPYRKPTYGDTASTAAVRNQASQKVPVRPGLATGHDDTSQPGFDFGLPATAQYSTPPSRQDARQFSDGDYGSHDPQQQPQGHQNNPPQSAQFPPRKGSRPQGQGSVTPGGFRHPYNQPNQSSPPTDQQRQPHRGPPEAYSGHPQNRRGPTQEYSLDDRGVSAPHIQDQDIYANERGNRQYSNQQPSYAHQPPPLSRSQTEPVYQAPEDQINQDPHRRGPLSRTQTYDLGNDQHTQYSNQGRQPQINNQGPGYDSNGYNVPPRPRTGNSARGPPQGHMGYDAPGSRAPTSALPISDRGHPIPVRPGLMTPSPAPPPVVQQPPVRMQQEVRPQQPQTTQQAPKAPVTTRELNDMRDAYRSRPHDDRLGLDFAKRLVEAASVLVSEGGRADPKQTARNRERYINDAYKIVKKLVSNGSSDAMFYLADCYGTGQLGLEVNPKEAFQLYTSAAKLDHPQGAYRVAVCCEMGSDSGGGTRRDYVKAVQFYKKAATLGDGPAMFKMGAILMKGLLGQQISRREGIQWLKRAAERADAENPHALHELGMIYENATPNDVVIKDERYAMELYMKAAGLGYKHSQSRLGAAYEYGLLGCPIDPQSSIMWYSKAAAQGEHLAEFALSGWYLTGAPPLLEASDQEAYLWARKAASSGLAKAEYAMGYYTETGIGTAPNVEEAKKWYFRAAAQHDERARTRLEEFKRGAGRKERGRVSRSGVGRQNEGECTVM